MIGIKTIIFNIIKIYAILIPKDNIIYYHKKIYDKIIPLCLAQILVLIFLKETTRKRTEEKGRKNQSKTKAKNQPPNNWASKTQNYPGTVIHRS